MQLNLARMQWEGKAIVLGQRKRMLRAWRIILICVALGVLYPVLGSEFSDTVAFLNGALIGLLGGVIIAWHQDRNTYVRTRIELPFTIHVFLVALGYTIGFAALILTVYSFTRSGEAGLSILDFIRSGRLFEFIAYGDFRLILVWALFFSLFLSFSLSISKKVAGGILFNTILGKYSKPKEEHRVFMFMDLDGSTPFAEKLGEERYFRLLNDFFADITPAIMLSGGEIYRYVGDQLAVSWLVTRKFDLTECVRAYFMARDLLFQRAEYYITEYDLVPSFKASMHDGIVVTAEVGDVKTQIVFHGDAVYVTEQIEKECRRLGCKFLMSGEFVEKVKLSGIYEKTYMGTVRVDSVEKEVDLYTIATVAPGQ